MTRALRFAAAAIAALMLLAGTASAQDYTGQWQGTVQDPAQPRRLVIRVTSEAGTLRVVLYSIDRAPQPYAGTLTISGSAARLSIPSITGTFDAKLSADGTEMTGMYAAQGAAALPLTLKHVSADAAWTVPTAPSPPKPMAADANLAFEVATIKPSQPGVQGGGIIYRGRQLMTLNQTLISLISFAYNVHARQVIGSAPWMDQDRYDITAQPEAEGQPNDRQLRAMMQKLLTERFKLTFHNEKRELAVYTITVSDKGPMNLTPSAGDPNGLPGLGFARLGALNAVNAKISDLAFILQNVVMDRPVLDQTKLPARYDFHLNWTPDQSQFGGRAGTPPDDPNAPPGIFTAVQEQLGLKLDSTKEPVDVIVIDRVDHPTDN